MSGADAPAPTQRCSLRLCRGRAHIRIPVVFSSNLRMIENWLSELAERAAAAPRLCCRTSLSSYLCK
jgi:hypothetical protein